MQYNIQFKSSFSHLWKNKQSCAYINPKACYHRFYPPSLRKVCKRMKNLKCWEIFPFFAEEMQNSCPKNVFFLKSEFWQRMSADASLLPFTRALQIIVVYFRIFFNILWLTFWPSNTPPLCIKKQFIDKFFYKFEKF